MRVSVYITAAKAEPGHRPDPSERALHRTLIEAMDYAPGGYVSHHDVSRETAVRWGMPNTIEAAP